MSYLHDGYIGAFDFKPLKKISNLEAGLYSPQYLVGIVSRKQKQGQIKQGLEGLR